MGADSPDDPVSSFSRGKLCRLCSGVKSTHDFEARPKEEWPKEINDLRLSERLKFEEWLASGACSLCKLPCFVGQVRFAMKGLLSCK